MRVERSATMNIQIGFAIWQLCSYVELYFLTMVEGSIQ